MEQQLDVTAAVLEITACARPQLTAESVDASAARVQAYLFFCACSVLCCAALCHPLPPPKVVGSVASMYYSLSHIMPRPTHTLHCSAVPALLPSLPTPHIMPCPTQFAMCPPCPPPSPPQPQPHPLPRPPHPPGYPVGAAAGLPPLCCPAAGAAAAVTLPGGGRLCCCLLPYTRVPLPVV